MKYVNRPVLYRTWGGVVFSAAVLAIGVITVVSARNNSHSFVDTEKPARYSAALQADVIKPKPTASTIAAAQTTAAAPSERAINTSNNTAKLTLPSSSTESRQSNELRWYFAGHNDGLSYAE